MFHLRMHVQFVSFTCGHRLARDFKSDGLESIEMIVDSHVHLLPRNVQKDRAPFCRSDLAFGSIYSSEKAKVVSEADIIRYLDDSGIDRAIVFGFPWEEPRSCQAEQ